MALAEALPPDASTASTGLGLRYIGQHCYALSGFYSTSTSSQTLLDFTSGAGYILASFLPFGPIEFADPTGGRKANFQMDFNGVGVLLARTDPQSSGTASSRSPAADILIPPFTRVTVTVDASDSDVDTKMGVMITGRVYEA